MRTLWNRRDALKLAAAGLAAGVVGCRSKSTSSGSGKPFAGEELLVFNWSDYLDPDLLAEFEEQTGAQLVYDNYSSDAELETRLLTGGGGYDLVVPSDRSMPALLGKKLLSPIDHDLLPNLRHLEPKFLNAPFDRGNRFSVPYFWGTVAVGVRADKAPDSDKGFAPLFDSRYRGRITMLDDGEHVVAITLKHLGLPMNSVAAEDLAKAKAVLLEQRSLVQAYTSDAYKEKLISGDAWISLGWSGDLRQAADEEPQVRVHIPPKGTTIWLDSLALCQGAPNPKLAHAFINFLLDPEVAARNAGFVHYATPNQAALTLLPPAIRDDESVYPPEGVLARCEWLTDRGADIAKVEAIWRDVRS